MPLDAVVVLSLAAAGVGALGRALPWPAAWLARKPLSCVACMAGWSSMAVLGAARWGLEAYIASPAEAVLTWLAMTGAGAVLLAQTGMFVQPFDLEPGAGGTPTSPPSSMDGQPHGP